MVSLPEGTPFAHKKQNILGGRAATPLDLSREPGYLDRRGSPVAVGIAWGGERGAKQWPAAGVVTNPTRPEGSFSSNSEGIGSRPTTPKYNRPHLTTPEE